MILLYHYLKNKDFRYWKKRKAGVKTIDEKMGVGYYFPTQFSSFTGQQKEFKMQSGRRGVYELISYRLFSDPSDMIKESYWCFIGYVDHTPVNETTFEEFLDIYGWLATRKVEIDP